MPLFRHLCRIAACATLTSGFGFANTEFSTTSLPPLPEPIRVEMSEVEEPSYLDRLRAFSLIRFFSPSFATPLLELDNPEEALISEFPGCSVAPLQEIEDEQAASLENRTASGFGAVDLDGLTPSTQLALARFQRMVTNAGGFIAITSAYRPASYQEHLRDVWEKWMLELRYNNDPACEELRAEVREEFEAHQLLPSQRPVVSSDHTRGLSFDASVRLPGTRKGRKRRVSLDSLARRAGVLRPDIRRDPVHFKLAM